MNLNKEIIASYKKKYKPILMNIFNIWRLNNGVISESKLWFIFEESEINKKEIEILIEITNNDNITNIKDIKKFLNNSYSFEENIEEIDIEIEDDIEIEEEISNYKNKKNKDFIFELKNIWNERELIQFLDNFVLKNESELLYLNEIQEMFIQSANIVKNEHIKEVFEFLIKVFDQKI